MSDLFTESGPEIDPSKDYFQELVGEDKRFKSPAELARGKVEADNFIKRLEAEQAELRKELNGRISLEKFLEEAKATRTPISEEVTKPDSPEVPSVEEIINRVKQEFAQQETNAARDRNTRSVKEQLDKNGVSPAELAKRVSENGMSQEQASRLAAESPKAFLALFGNPVRVSPEGVTTSTVNLDGSLVAKRGMSYYQNLLKTDIKKYYSPEVQKEMYNSIRQIGWDEFNKI